MQRLLLGVKHIVLNMVCNTIQGKGINRNVCEYVQVMCIYRVEDIGYLALLHT